MITESRSGKIVMFVDDHDVLYRAGTCITAETARRFPGNPVIPAGQRPWESLIGWCSVHRNAGSGLYKLWYDGFNRKPAKDPMSCVVCVATSNDGRAWEYPELQYHPFDGGPTNIAVIGNGGHSHRYCCSVVEDPKRTFGERYVMGYYDFGIQDGQEYPGLHIAHSDDGLRWTVVPGAPFHRTAYGIRHDDVPLSSEPAVVPGQWRYRLGMSDAVDLFYDPVQRKHRWCGKMWLDGPDGKSAWKHGVGCTGTEDFTDWDPPTLVLWPDDHDEDSVEFHTGSVFRHNGVYFCLLQILNRGEGAGIIDVELAVSRDGFRWDRPFRDSRFIYRNSPSAFDSGCILTNSSPVVLADEIRFYYGATSSGATGAAGLAETVQSGVGYAYVGRDRFACIRDTEGVGQITLKPRAMNPGTTVSINANASGGEIRLELLDSGGRRIEGFTREQCEPVRVDSLAAPVRWDGARDGRLPSGEIMVRVHLRNAGIYAISFT